MPGIGGVRAALCVALIASLGLAACGGGDETGTTAAASSAPTTVTDATETTDATEATDVDDSAQIESLIKGWLTEGGCERMSDAFLEEQTFISERNKACEAFEGGFTEPAYGPDDIVVSDVEVKGDHATAVVGDTNTDITADYELVREDGTWLIDSAF